MPLRVCLTNDDGYRSPLAPLLLKILPEFGECGAFFPAEEQSWKGKAITRHGYLEQWQEQIAGCEVQVLRGTPADCVNIGIFRDPQQKPDLVVSGVNVGCNIGLGFVMSSGTVGACLEANLAGVPAIAFSQDLTEESYRFYREHRTLPDDVFRHLAKEQAAAARSILAVFFDTAGGLLTEPVTWSVNLPFPLQAACRVRVCSLSRSAYGSCFSCGPQGFFHNLEQVPFNMAAGEDADRLQRGDITVSRLDLREFGRISRPKAAALNQLFNRRTAEGPPA